MTSRHDNPYFTEEIDPQELEERTDRLAELSHQILTELGEDADRDGLQETPVRVAKRSRHSPEATIRIPRRCSVLPPLRTTTARW